MCPTLTFSLGVSASVRAYTLFAVLAAVCALILLSLMLRRSGLKIKEAAGLALLLLISFVVGARLLNRVVNPLLYSGGMHLYSFRMTGFSLYGGVILSCAGLLAWTLIKRRSFWPLADALVLPAGVSFAISRAGCYLNGCCGGKATNGWFGVVFPASASEQSALSRWFGFLPNVSVAVHPTQLYEIVAALAGLVPVLWLYLRKDSKLPSGCAFLLYGLWMTACRWAILPLRALPYSDVVVHVFYPALYGALLAAGGILLWSRLRKKQL